MKLNMGTVKIAYLGRTPRSKEANRLEAVGKVTGKLLSMSVSN